MNEFVNRSREASSRRENDAEQEFAGAAAPLEPTTLTRLRPRSSTVDDLRVTPPAMEARQAPAADPVVSPLRAAGIRSAWTRRPLVALAGLAALACGGVALTRYVTVGRFIYSTDDAYVRTDLAIISPKIAGYVQDVDVVDNQHVKSGQVLALIDAGDYALAVDASHQKALTQDATIARINAQADAQQAVVAQAEAQVEGARAERARAQSEFDRVRSLAASDFASKQRLDQVLADRDKAAAGLSGAEARLAGEKANLVVLKSQGRGGPTRPRRTRHR